MFIQMDYLPTLEFNAKYYNYIFQLYKTKQTPNKMCFWMYLLHSSLTP